MYEHLKGRKNFSLLSNLRPLSEGEISASLFDGHAFPESYSAFLREIGVGVLVDDSFVFLERPLDAAKDIYLDEQIYCKGTYELGARGVVWVFGTDSVGTSFGFDSGDDWRLVEVDNYRLVERLGLEFQEFVEGLLACHPQSPKYFSAGKWFDSAGTICK
jgi:hypothetical protein